MIIEYPDSELLGIEDPIHETVKERLNSLFPKAMKGISMNSDIIVILQKQDNLLQILKDLDIEISPFLESILLNNRDFNYKKQVMMSVIIHTREHVEVQVNIVKKANNKIKWSIIYHINEKDEPVIYIKNTIVSYRLDQFKKECNSPEHTLAVSDLLTYLLCRDQIIEAYKSSMNSRRKLSKADEKALIEKGLFNEFVSLYMIEHC